MGRRPLRRRVARVCPGWHGRRALRPRNPCGPADRVLGRRPAAFPLHPATVARALLGRGDHLVSPNGLRALLAADLAGLPVALHVVAADVVTGEELLLSTGSVLAPCSPAPPCRVCSPRWSAAGGGWSTAPSPTTRPCPRPSPSAPTRSTCCRPGTPAPAAPTPLRDRCRAAVAGPAHPRPAGHRDRAPPSHRAARGHAPAVPARGLAPRLLAFARCPRCPRWGWGRRDRRHRHGVRRRLRPGRRWSGSRCVAGEPQ